MSLFEWLVVRGTRYLFHTRANNSFLRQEYKGYEHDAWLDEWKKECAENERKGNVNRIRKQMPCLFLGEPSSSEFEKLALGVAKQFKRIKNIIVWNAVVYATVESQTGLTDWGFTVDFNNWGHIDGTYWTYSDNDDSSIPKRYGMTLSSILCTYLSERGIDKPDFSSVVKGNTALGTERALEWNCRERIVKKLFRGRNDCVHIRHDSKFYCGEHIYPVISLLIQEGFVDIESIAIEDVDDNSPHYVYEVCKVSIEGICDFQRGYAFSRKSEVVIYYHSKRRIVMPCAESQFKRKNYVSVGDRLQSLGFTSIYERPIKDLVVGLIVKDGSVENVFVDEGEESSIERGKRYYYDTKIIICYHTYK